MAYLSWCGCVFFFTKATTNHRVSFTAVKNACLKLLHYVQILPYRVREAKRQGKAVIDGDGSYLYRKRMQLEASGMTCAPLPLPSFPPLGWTLLTETNQMEMKALMPVVYPTTLYEYLAEGVGNVSGAHAFRALTRGYTHWASGRLNKLEANTCNPTLCFVCCQMRPSMKSGFYTVKIILRKHDDNVASIAQATCQCAAGYVISYSILLKLVMCVCTVHVYFK